MNVQVEDIYTDDSLAVKTTNIMKGYENGKNESVKINGLK